MGIAEIIITALLLPVLRSSWRQGQADAKAMRKWVREYELRQMIKDVRRERKPGWMELEDRLWDEVLDLRYGKESSR